MHAAPDIRQVRACCDPRPRPTDLLAEAPTLPLELKEVNVDH
jgi:hypothetical protein